MWQWGSKHERNAEGGYGIKMHLFIRRVIVFQVKIYFFGSDRVDGLLIIG